MAISEEEANKVLPVVNILPITSRKLNRKIYLNEALLPTNETGLHKESILMCYQIRTIDKKRLVKMVGKIDSPKLRLKIMNATMFQLGLKR